MKICFFHEEFDRDVSSGTSHSMYQWGELLHAFGITECAVINNTNDSFNIPKNNIICTEYTSLENFFDSIGNSTYAFVENGNGTDFRVFEYSKVEWLLFGGTGEIIRSDITIPTCDEVSLYPREAVAIILSVSCLQH